MSLLLLFRPSSGVIVPDPIYYPIFDGIASIVHTFAGVLSITASDARVSASITADQQALGITPTIPGNAGIEATHDG